MSPRESRVLVEAEFDPNAITYEVISTAVIMACSVILIPVLPIVWLLTDWYTRRYYRSLRVALTSRDLIVEHGVWSRTEMSVPLEKITDLAIVQGPIMRRYGVMALRVETAGQTGGMGTGLVTVTGIVGCRDFRDQVLAQRDRIAEAESADTATGAVGRDNGAEHDGPRSERLLTEIRDLLVRIERRVSDGGG